MSVDRPLRVPYNIPGSPYWQWVNIYTRMTQERIIFLNQPLSDGLANSIISGLLYLESEDQTKPIYIYINSIGDPIAAGMASPEIGMMSVSAGFAIYDTIRHIKSEIVTICMGQAVGMSAVLLSSGTKGKRASLPHSMIALSNPQSGFQGQATDLQLRAQEVLKKKTRVLEILAENTGQTVEKLSKDMSRMFYMTADEAVEYGLIDQVLKSQKQPAQEPIALVK